MISYEDLDDDARGEIVRHMTPLTRFPDLTPLLHLLSALLFSFLHSFLHSILLASVKIPVYHNVLLLLIL